MEKTKVAIVGMGTVGTGVARLLLDHSLAPLIRLSRYMIQLTELLFSLPETMRWKGRHESLPMTADSQIKKSSISL